LAVRAHAYDGGVSLSDLQAPALAELDAAIARASEIVDSELLTLAAQRIEHIVAGGPTPVPPRDDREADVAAVIEQMLIDVAGIDDALVQKAQRHFGEGELADLVMASYAIEARTRLRVADERLWGAS
jgi:hypothetical protein